MGSIDGRVAFVTGAASGIGRAAAIALAREGARVMVTDIDAPGGRETAAMITGSGGIAQFRGQDVTEEDRWAELATRTLDLFGRLDILVNNAGIGIGVPITDMTLDQWNRQLAINMTGVFLGMKHAIPAMRTAKPEGVYRGGSIINISSVAGLVGSAGLSGYCATKGGVRLFTKAVAMECAAAQDGIRVNSVHRHHRHADMGQDRCRRLDFGGDPAGQQRRHSRYRCCRRNAAGLCRSTGGHCRWHCFPRLGCVALHDGE